MAYEKKDNEGALFFNKKPQGDKSPHFSGPAMVDGVDYYMSAWMNDGRFNVKFKKKDFTEAIEAAKNTKVVTGAPDDEIPF